MLNSIPWSWLWLTRLWVFMSWWCHQAAVLGKKSYCSTYCCTKKKSSYLLCAGMFAFLNPPSTLFVLNLSRFALSVMAEKTDEIKRKRLSELQFSMLQPPAGWWLPERRFVMICINGSRGGGHNPSTVSIFSQYLLLLFSFLKDTNLKCRFTGHKILTWKEFCCGNNT